MDRRTEPELIRAAQAGDKDAFGALIATHERVLVYICRSRTATTQDAQDAWQRTQLEIWKSLPGFYPSGAFKAWACRIATIHAGRQGEDAKRVWAVESDESRQTWTRAAVEPVDSAPGPEEVAMVQSLRDELRDIRDSMPSAYRDVWVLRYEEELDDGVIADMLGIQVNTVRTRAFRARAHMRAEMERLSGRSEDAGGHQ